MILTAGGLALVKHFEGLCLAAYFDRVRGGVLTIGYGHTHGVVEGMTITEPQAEGLLHLDIASAAKTVRSVAGDATTDRQFSAMVSLAYNIGNAAFRSSTVLREHRATSHPVHAADAFLMWNKMHVDGVLVYVHGLDVRRRAERAMYMTPDTADFCLHDDNS